MGRRRSACESCGKAVSRYANARMLACGAAKKGLRGAVAVGMVNAAGRKLPLVTRA